jgi:hypothetical protein
MTPFVFIASQIVIVIGLYLIVVGWVGVISGTSFIDRSPLGLRRPTTYALAAWLIFLEPLKSTLGVEVAQTLFLLVAATVIFETVRPLVDSSVNVTGTNPETVDAEVRNALANLGVKYAGNYPDYKLKDPWARLRVKYRRHVGEAKITIYPSSQRPLLRKIENLIEKDLDQKENSHLSKGFTYDILEGVLLIGVAIWKIGSSL